MIINKLKDLFFPKPQLTFLYNGDGTKAPKKDELVGLHFKHNCEVVGRIIANTGLMITVEFFSHDVMEEVKRYLKM